MRRHLVAGLVECVCLGLLAVLAALVMPVMICVADDAPQQIVVGSDKEIFGNQKAADLVAEARKHDPMFCPIKPEDRDKAISLYEQAIAAQPGAKINAPLANRIAQLYAFYQDKEKTVTPDSSKAGLWWKRCVEYTSPKQLLWAQAQIGLAGLEDYNSAVAIYDKILDSDATQVELPDWKVFSDRDIDREQARLQDSVERVRLLAARKKSEALAAIERTSARRKGSSTRASSEPSPSTGSADSPQASSRPSTQPETKLSAITISWSEWCESFSIADGRVERTWLTRKADDNTLRMSPDSFDRHISQGKLTDQQATAITQWVTKHGSAIFALKADYRANPERYSTTFSLCVGDRSNSIVCRGSSEPPELTAAIKDFLAIMKDVVLEEKDIHSQTTTAPTTLPATQPAK